MIDKQKIKNIIFDFGGVLFEIDYELPIKAFGELGFSDFSEMHTQAGQNPIFDLLETGKISDDEFISQLQLFVPKATKEQIKKAWNSILIRLMPEQVLFVKKLRSLGYHTLLLSNTNAIHVAAFENLIEKEMDIVEFRSSFHKIYYSNVLGMRKPYPETFLKVCELNHLDAGETLFIDDSLQHVLGAQEAGLLAYHLKSGEKLNSVMSALL